MKTQKYLLLFLVLLLAACAPRNEWTTYSVSDEESVAADVFLPYTFSYPSHWTIEEGNNHIALVSHAKLLKDVPEKLKPGQIVVSMSMNINMSPEEMVQYRAGSLRGVIEFEDLVSTEIKGRPAAYQAGKDPANDDFFILAVDVGHTMRALLVARMAEGELDVQRETLMTLAKSFQVQP